MDSEEQREYSPVSFSAAKQKQLRGAGGNTGKRGQAERGDKLEPRHIA